MKRSTSRRCAATSATGSTRASTTATTWSGSADTADRAVVARDVLGRALTHLAGALPRMDAAVIDAALAQCEQAQAELTAEMERLLAAVRRISRPTAAEELIARADQVLDELVVSVQDWVAELRVRTGDSYDDAAFVERVEQLEEEIRGWALDGFGSGSAAWVEKAHVRMRRAAASAQVLHRRAERDPHRDSPGASAASTTSCCGRREEFWRGMAEALRPRLAGLPRPATPARARSPGSPSRYAKRATRARTWPRPWRRRSTSGWTTAPGCSRRCAGCWTGCGRRASTRRPGPCARPLVFPDTREGAADLYLYLNELARKAIYEAAVLLKKETQTMAEALLAYGEQFEDSFIRSGDVGARVPQARRRLPRRAVARGAHRPGDGDGQGRSGWCGCCTRWPTRPNGEATGEAGVTPSFRVAVVGPSRVGKTTLLTAILSDTGDPPRRHPGARSTMDERTQRPGQAPAEGAAAGARPRVSSTRPRSAAPRTMNQLPGHARRRKATTRRRSRSSCSTTRARGWTPRSGRE